MKKLVLTSIVLGSLVVSCKYNNWEEIKPAPAPVTGGCDTTNITWANSAKVIFETSCGSKSTNCHSAGSNDPDLSDQVVSQGFLPSIRDRITRSASASGYMPKGGWTLDPCDKNKLIRWVNTGGK